MTTTTDRLDGQTSSVAVKAPVNAVSTENLTLSGLQTVGGVALAEGDRVLVKDQSTGSQNGIYLASSTAWTRAKDFNGARDVVRGTLVVANYDNGQGLFFRVTTADPIVIGTTSLAFSPIVSANNNPDITPAEVAASVTPTDYTYQEGDVRRYGALLDGATDDTTAFQRAISVNLAGGNEVYFPAGDTRITGLTFASGVKIRGAGNKKSVITIPSGTARTAFKVANTALFNDGAVFEDFGIIFSNSADIGFDLSSASRCSLSRIRIWGDANQASRRGTGVLFDASVASCYANTLLDCDIRDCTKNLHYRKGANSNQVYGGQILNGTDCIYQEGTGGTDRIDNCGFFGTRIETSYGDCIHLSGDVWGWGFHGCRIEAYQSGSVAVRVAGGDATLPPTVFMACTVAVSSGASDYNFSALTGRVFIWGQDANQYQGTTGSGSYHLGQKTTYIGNPAAAGAAVLEAESSDTNADLQLTPKGTGLVQIGASGAGGAIGSRFLLIDGITAPATVGGAAQLYVDSADGDLKIKFGDGTVKTIVVDT